MKKNISAFMLFSFFVTSSFAAQNNLLSQCLALKKHVEQKFGLPVVPRNDGADALAKRSVKTFQLDSMVNQEWDDSLKIYRPGSKLIYQFNAAGQFTRIAYLGWSDSLNKWQQVMENWYTYNTSGQLEGDSSSFIFFGSSPISTKSKIAYDAQGKQLSRIRSTSLAGVGWMETQKLTYSYDVSGNLVLLTDSSSGGLPGEWEPDAKMEFRYSSGKRIERINSIWEDSVALPEIREQYHYDTQGRLDSTTSYEWDSSDNTWIFTSLEIFGYNNSGDMNKDETYSRSDDAWVIEEQSIFTFNQNQKLSDGNFPFMDSEESVTEVIPDLVHAPSLVEAQIWDGLAFQPLEKSTFYIGTPRSTKATPFNTRATASVFLKEGFLMYHIPEGSVHLSLYDARGRETLSTFISGNGKMPMPGAGVRFYRLHTGSFVENGRLSR